MPLNSEFIAQQAASLLPAGRLHLVAQRSTPLQKMGGYYPTQLERLLRYEQQRHLQFLFRQAQELNLGYD
jgi:hypothetical protein